MVTPTGLRVESAALLQLHVVVDKTNVLGIVYMALSRMGGTRSSAPKGAMHLILGHFLFGSQQRSFW